MRPHCKRKTGGKSFFDAKAVQLFSFGKAPCHVVQQFKKFRRERQLSLSAALHLLLSRKDRLKQKYVFCALQNVKEWREVPQAQGEENIAQVMEQLDQTKENYHYLNRASVIEELLLSQDVAHLNALTVPVHTEVAPVNDLGVPISTDMIQMSDLSGPICTDMARINDISRPVHTLLIAGPALHPAEKVHSAPPDLSISNLPDRTIVVRIQEKRTNSVDKCVQTEDLPKVLMPLPSLFAAGVQSVCAIIDINHTGSINVDMLTKCLQDDASPPMIFDQEIKANVTEPVEEPVLGSTIEYQVPGNDGETMASDELVTTATHKTDISSDEMNMGDVLGNFMASEDLEDNENLDMNLDVGVKSDNSSPNSCSISLTKPVVKRKNTESKISKLVETKIVSNTTDFIVVELKSQSEKNCTQVEDQTEHFKDQMAFLSTDSEGEDCPVFSSTMDNSMESEAGLTGGTYVSIEESSVAAESICEISDGNEAARYQCLICGHKFASVHKMRQHYLSHPRDGMYVCHLCGKLFNMVKSRPLFRLHMQQHCSTSTHACTICGKQFDSDLFLQRHTSRYTKPYARCPACNKVFPYCLKRKMSLHLREHFIKDPSLPDKLSGTNVPLVDQKEFISETDLIDLEDLKRSEREISNFLKAPRKCSVSVCDNSDAELVECREEVVETSNHLISAMHGSYSKKDRSEQGFCDQNTDVKEFNILSDVAVPICSRGSSMEESGSVSLLEEGTVGAEDVPWMQQINRPVFNRKNKEKSGLAKVKIKDGIITVDSSELNNGNHECPYCQKILNAKANLRAHIRFQHEGAKHMCDVCGKTFAEKRYYMYHVQYHHGDKSEDFVCHQCGKTYRTKRHLQGHIQTSHYLHPVTCIHCGLTLKNKYILKDHIAIRHTRDAQYQCKYCGKKLISKKALCVHVNRHEGKKPYKCDQCDRSFYTTGGRSSHRKTHTKCTWTTSVR